MFCCSEHTYHHQLFRLWWYSNSPLQPQRPDQSLSCKIEDYFVSSLLLRIFESSLIFQTLMVMYNIFAVTKTAPNSITQKWKSTTKVLCCSKHTHYQWSFRFWWYRRSSLQPTKPNRSQLRKVQTTRWVFCCSEQTTQMTTSYVISKLLRTCLSLLIIQALMVQYFILSLTQAGLHVKCTISKQQRKLKMTSGNRELH